MPDLPVEEVRLVDLRPHPQNYRVHPQDQIEHLKASLADYGWFRNVVVARDNTILAGHGIVEAAIEAGRTTAPVYRLDLDPEDPAALKVLALDNEVGRFAQIDDRALTELLRTINAETPSGLLGTGYDEQILANLVMVTRPAHEIADFNAAAEWVGMPEFGTDGRVKLVIQFEDEAARAEFVKQVGIRVTREHLGRSWTAWWPSQERDDSRSVRFNG